MGRLATAEQWGIPERGFGAAKQTQGVFASAGVNAAGALVLGGPIAAGIALASTLIMGLVTGQLFSGCGQTCVTTTKWANAAEDALRQNLQAYLGQPAPRSPESQAAALANFDQLWAYLVQQCSQGGLGPAGENCIADRQPGACKWKDNGQCWNWFVGYRDPIANDPNVASISPLEAVASFLPAGADGSTILPLALIAGLVALGVSL